MRWRLLIFCKVPGYPLNFSFDFIQWNISLTDGVKNFVLFCYTFQVSSRLILGSFACESSFAQCRLALRLIKGNVRVAINFLQDSPSPIECFVWFDQWSLCLFNKDDLCTLFCYFFLFKADMFGVVQLLGFVVCYWNVWPKPLITAMSCLFLFYKVHCYPLNFLFPVTQQNLALSDDAKNVIYFVTQSKCNGGL